MIASWSCQPVNGIGRSQCDRRDKPDGALVDDMSLFSRFGLLLRRELSARMAARPRRAGQWRSRRRDPSRGGGGRSGDGPRARPEGTPAEPSSVAAQDPTMARYYANLGLPYGADLDAVRAARRWLLKRYHPDLHSADTEKRRTATQVTQGLNRAHDELVSRLDRK